MVDGLPFLLLRARPTPTAAPAEFDAWFRDVHLRDVARIPGIVHTRAARTVGGTRLGFYTFESGEAVQSALASPEAAYARGTWERWAAQLEELSVEIFAPLVALPVYRSAS